jgi:uncharacterized protein involved in exopolysaccharide biosynthesis
VTQTPLTYTPSNAISLPKPGGAPAELSLLGAFNTVIRRRAIVILAVAISVGIALAIALTRPVRFTVQTAFIPEGQRAASGMSSIAAQFGVNVASSDGLSSPLFYPELVRSPQFLGAIADSTYALNGQPPRPLADIYEIPAGDARARRAAAIRTLSGNLQVNAAPRTGIVTVGVTASSPALARDLADRILAEITRFNQHTRQGRAAAERSFIERRLSDVRDSLRRAEDRLQAFLLENRDIRTSPAVAFRHARLEREVEAQQILLSTLLPSYEQAKIEEVRDTPVITVIRRPEAPVNADPRGRVRLMAMAVLLGLAAGAALALLFEAIAAVRRSDDPAAVELASLTSGIRKDLRARNVLLAVLGTSHRA